MYVIVLVTFLKDKGRKNNYLFLRFQAINFIFVEMCYLAAHYERKVKRTDKECSILLFISRYLGLIATTGSFLRKQTCLVWILRGHWKT